MDVDGALGNWIFNWELSHENVIARRRSALYGIRSDFPHIVQFQGFAYRFRGDARH